MSGLITKMPSSTSNRRVCTTRRHPPLQTILEGVDDKTCFTFHEKHPSLIQAHLWLIAPLVFLRRVLVRFAKSPTSTFDGVAGFGARLEVYDRKEIKDLHVMFQRIRTNSEEFRSLFTASVGSAKGLTHQVTFQIHSHVVNSLVFGKTEGDRPFLPRFFYLELRVQGKILAV